MPLHEPGFREAVIGPLVLVVDRHARAHPDARGATVAEYRPLAEALATVHELDAHTAAYSVPEVPHRLCMKDDADGRLVRVWDVVPAVTMVLLIADVDAPGHVVSPEWRAGEGAKILRLLQACPEGYVYETRGGYRIVYRLQEPLVMRGDADARRWKATYKAWLAQLAEFGITGDPACSDWTRLFRLPRVYRDGAYEDRPRSENACVGAWSREIVPAIVEDEPQVITFGPVGDMTPEEREHLRSRLAAHGPAIQGSGGNQHTYQAACVARSWGVPEREAVAALSEWNATCVPPWSSGELEDVVRNAYAYGQGDEGEELAKHRALVPFVAWLKGPARVALAPVYSGVPEPSRDAVIGEWKAAGKRLAGKSTGPAQASAAILKRVLKREHLGADGDDPAVVVATAASVLVQYAPLGTTDRQIAGALAASFVPPDVALAAVAAARVSPVTALGALPRISPSPAAREILAAAGDPQSDEEIRARLLTSKGDGVRACGSNAEMILRHSAQMRGALQHDEITKIVACVAGPFAGESANGLPVVVKNWFETAWGLFVPGHIVEEQMLYVARKWHSVNPLVRYLDGVAWDGRPRLDSWLHVYCRAAPTAYNARVGAMWLLSAVARARRPGCKVDTVLVLEGEQGAKKSTTFRILGGEWYSDTPLVLGDKDSYLITGSTWIVELAELSSLRGSDVERHKNFLSSAADKFRPPYGRVPERFERRCVFGGSTNEREYLRDSTGNRRFHCVPVLGIADVEQLERDRDQLWAEAVARFCAGEARVAAGQPRLPTERWWFEASEQAEANQVTREREPEDPWADAIRTWLDRRAERSPFTLGDVASQVLSLGIADLKRSDRAVAHALRRAGCERRRDRAGEGNARMLWFPPEDAGKTLVTADALADLPSAPPADPSWWPRTP